MKQLVLIALVSVFAGAASAQVQQILDAPKAKLRVSLVPETGADCKLSIKEINEYDGHTVGKRYLCAQMLEVNTEISLSKLAQLVRENKVAFAFTGAQAVSALQTLNAWREALITKGDMSAEFLANVKPWSFRIEKQAAGVTTIRLANEAAGQSVTFDVKMFAVFPKTK